MNAGREAARRLRSPEPLFKGQIVYLLCAKECEGCEDSKEPIVDPTSFTWLVGVVTEVEVIAEDGMLCTRVNESSTGIGLYERRFIVTENERALLGFPDSPEPPT